ncbi:MAG: NADH-quinone oxidoreductase subunit NuoF [Dissulfurispiraceae bacterium]|nr:NADH-quinone oxidoreductase subunit NuoF [Dissulfurispiraceae bacterium]
MSNKIAIRVCMGPAGIAAGGKAVLDEFQRILSDKNIPADVRNRCSHGQVGCMGLCSKDVLVDIEINGKKTTYSLVKPQMVKQIVDEHIVAGSPVKQWLADDHMDKFLEKQEKIVLSDCGVIDPEDIEAYISRDGYSSCKKILASMKPEQLVHEIKLSGLRGRGGAGFPTGLKWEIAAKSEGSIKYIICNADEGDPGAFMDRAIIEGNPHAIIEGMIIGAYAIGAQKGYVYIRAEYPLAVQRLENAIKQSREIGFLGSGIFDTNMDFDIEIKLGAGAFVCGEETALIASIEGQRGMPRAKPPFPVHKGLWGRPTVINNAETLANIPYIMRKGSGWFSGLGTEDSKGTKVFALTGKIKNSGLIEVPMGITLREIIYDIGGGIEKGKHLKAVQTGGPSGGCIPADMLDISVDYESLAKAGCIVGSGGMIVLANDDCMVNIARYFLNFTQSESCGKCVPCRIGTKRMLEILDKITNGLGEPEDIEKLEQLSNDIKLGSLCGLGQTAPNPVLSTLKYFRDEYEAHIYDKKCPAGVCNALLTFTIIEDSCKGCQACAKACPAGAITGDKKKLHIINQTLCIKCGACFEACRFKAVHKA